MQFITTEQVAEILHISRESVRRLVKSGNLKNHKVPYAKSNLFDIQEVMAFKAQEESTEWLSRKEASNLLGISESLLSYYVKIYKVPSSKVNYGLQRVRFKTSDILNLKKYIIKE